MESESCFGNYIAKWNKPEGDSSFTRTCLIGEAIGGLTYFVVRSVFTLLSLVPGSNQWVKENVSVVKNKEVDKSNFVLINTFAKYGFLSDGDVNVGNRYPAHKILPSIYKAVVLSLNPWATINISNNDPLNCFSSKLFKIAQDFSRSGLVTGVDEVTLYTSGKSEEVADDDSWGAWCKREVGARIAYFGATLAMTIEKVAYLAAGVFVAAVAALPLNIAHALGCECVEGVTNQVNAFTAKYLSAGGVIDNILDGIHATLYPSDFLDTNFRIHETHDDAKVLPVQKEPLKEKVSKKVEQLAVPIKRPQQRDKPRPKIMTVEDSD